MTDIPAVFLSEDGWREACLARRPEAKWRVPERSVGKPKRSDEAAVLPSHREMPSRRETRMYELAWPRYR